MSDVLGLHSSPEGGPRPLLQSVLWSPVWPYLVLAWGLGFWWRLRTEKCDRVTFVLGVSCAVRTRRRIVYWAPESRGPSLMTPKAVSLSRGPRRAA